MTRPTTGFPELPAAGGPVRRARRAHRAVFSAAGTEPTAFCPEQARCPHPADLNRPSGRGRRGCTAYVPHAVVVSRQARSSPSPPTAKSVSSGKTPGQKSLQKSCTHRRIAAVDTVTTTRSPSAVANSRTKPRLPTAPSETPQPASVPPPARSVRLSASPSPGSPSPPAVPPTPPSPPPPTSAGRSASATAPPSSSSAS